MIDVASSKQVCRGGTYPFPANLLAVPTRPSYTVRMDRDSRKRRLERFCKNEKIFPGGDHPTGNCGACARIITDRFGGRVVGYYHADNPTARVGEVEFGHDFAITEDRFLVDPWLFHYYAEPPVLDLTEPAGQAEAAARYGPEEKWELVPDRAALVKVERARSAQRSQTR